MEQILNEQEIIGKTIKSFIEGDKLILVFEDKTFATFSTGYDNEISIDDYPCDMTEDNHNRHFLKSIGAISEERTNEIFEAHQAEIKETQIKADLKKLAELKSKYPDGQ